MPDAIGSIRTHRRRIVAGVALVAIVAVTAALLARDEIADRLIDPAPTVPSETPAASLSQEEQAFYDFVSPRLVRVSAEANELVRLANGRSRNLIELQTRGARVESGGREIDAYLSAHGTPTRFEHAVRDYRAGIAAVRAGMDEARSGFLSFDWERVASAVDQFDAGSARLNEALDALHLSSGATPATNASPAAMVE